LQAFEIDAVFHGVREIAVGPCRFLDTARHGREIALQAHLGKSGELRALPPGLFDNREHSFEIVPLALFAATVIPHLISGHHHGARTFLIERFLDRLLRPGCSLRLQGFLRMESARYGDGRA
jgi:hypothetical protein